MLTVILHSNSTLRVLLSGSVDYRMEPIQRLSMYLWKRRHGSTFMPLDRWSTGIDRGDSKPYAREE